MALTKLGEVAENAPRLFCYLIDLVSLGRTISGSIFHSKTAEASSLLSSTKEFISEADLHEKDYEHVCRGARPVHGAPDICSRRSGPDRLLERSGPFHHGTAPAIDDPLDLHCRWQSRRITPSLSAGLSVRSTACDARSRRVAPFEERRVRRDDRGALPRGSRAFHLARHDDREGKGTVQVPVRQR
mgnify:CR=1 FL=1